MSSHLREVKLEEHEQKVSDRNRIHEEAYMDLGTHSGEVTEMLVESTEKLVDFDGSEMGLFPYQYTVGNCVPIDVLVKKGSFTQKLTAENFKQVQQLKSKILLPVLNLYHRGSNGCGWFIIAPVKGSFKGWLTKTGGSSLFEGTHTIRAMSRTFRMMLLDFFSLFSEMRVLQIVPVKIKMEDLFMTILADNVPRLQMLLTEVKYVGSVPPHLDVWGSVWSDLATVVGTCCQICNCKLDRMSINFFNFLPKCTNITHAINYPDLWNQDEKASYLHHIISGKTPVARDKMRSKVNVVKGLEWSDECNEAIDALLKLTVNQDDRGRPLYDKRFIYDCVLLFRDTHKHFDKRPAHIKRLLNTTRQGFIELLEKWNPEIWIKLYEAIGPLGRQILD